MRDKYQRINYLLYFFRNNIKDNPQYTLTFNNIYSELTTFDVNYKKNIKKLFNRWKKHFKNNPKCNAYDEISWNYFCQFISADSKAKNALEHLKVYIPLEASYIEKGAIEIFEFLSNNNITHLSKIGAEIRNDGIVVRLINPSDLDKLIDFVNNNEYLQKGLIKANPFAFNYRGLSLAVDGELSYNTVIAMMIKLYLSYRLESHAIDMVGTMDFKNFVIGYYQKIFNSHEGFVEFCKDFGMIEKRSITPKVFLNYRNVLELFIKSMDEKFSYQDYLNHYLECANESIQLSKMQDIKRIVFKNDKPQKTNQDQYNELEKKAILMFQNIIQVMKVDEIDSLLEYIKTGKNDYLKCERGLREQIINSSFRSDVLKIVSMRNVPLEVYFNIVLDIVSRSDKFYLEQAIIETYKKYEDNYQKGESTINGIDMAINAIYHLIKYDSYIGFINNYDTRGQLEKNISSSLAKKIIMRELNITSNNLFSNNILDIIKQYVDSVINNSHKHRL